MATITLRSVKGSPLTNTEVDNNFTNLNNDKLESSSYTAADVLTKIKTVDGTGSGLDADLLDGLSTASTNTADTVVIRDGSGNFAAGTITATISGNVTGNVTGNADTATALATGRTISISGDMTYTSPSFDGSGNVTAAGTLATVNSNVGSFGSASAVPVITVNGKGLITAVSTSSISSDLDIAGDSGTDTVTLGSDTLTFDGGTGVTTTVTNNQVSIAIDQAVATSSDVQFDSFGVGTAASGTTGEIRATNDITAFYSSDQSLKENVRNIDGALDIVSQINGVRFDWTDDYIESKGGADGYFVRKADIGVIAQEIEQVLPEVVAEREDGIKGVKYDRIVSVLIEAVKELKAEIEELKRGN